MHLNVIASQATMFQKGSISTKIGTLKTQLSLQVKYQCWNILKDMPQYPLLQFL